MTLASMRNFRKHPPEFRRTKNKTLDVKSFYLSSNHFSTKHNRFQLVLITLPTAKRSPSCVNLSRQLFTEPDLALPVEDKKKIKTKSKRLFSSKKSLQPWDAARFQKYTLNHKNKSRESGTPAVQVHSWKRTFRETAGVRSK